MLHAEMKVQKQKLILNFFSSALTTSQLASEPYYEYIYDNIWSLCVDKLKKNQKTQRIII